MGSFCLCPESLLTHAPTLGLLRCFQSPPAHRAASLTTGSVHTSSPGRNTSLHYSRPHELLHVLQNPCSSTKSFQTLKTLFQAPTEHYGFYTGYATLCINYLFTCLLPCYVVSSLRERPKNFKFSYAQYLVAMVSNRVLMAE